MDRTSFQRTDDGNGAEHAGFHVKEQVTMKRPLPGDVNGDAGRAVLNALDQVGPRHNAIGRKRRLPIVCSLACSLMYWFL
jgi:hypothetical protein